MVAAAGPRYSAAPVRRRSGCIVVVPWVPTGTHEVARMTIAVTAMGVLTVCSVPTRARVLVVGPRYARTTPGSTVCVKHVALTRRLDCRQLGERAWTCVSAPEDGLRRPLRVDSPRASAEHGCCRTVQSCVLALGLGAQCMFGFIPTRDCENSRSGHYEGSTHHAG